MGRNLRMRAHPAPNPVSSYDVASHRYTWDGGTSSNPDAPTYHEWKASVPYQEGDVIYVAYNGEARKAFISDVFCDHDHDHDRFGDCREKYRIFMENKKGDRFAKNWTYTWPGFVQRGYALAGLAPDCEGKL